MPTTLQKFPSITTNEVYDVIRGDDGVIYCDCPSWKNRKNCRHLRQYLKDHPEEQSNKDKTIAIGDHVKIINPEEIYSTYSTWKGLKDCYNWVYDGKPEKNKIGCINHLAPHDSDSDTIIYLVDVEGQEYIMHEHGIKKCSSKDKIPQKIDFNWTREQLLDHFKKQKERK